MINLKKTLIRFIVFVCLISLLCPSVFAITDASDQLASYEADVRHIGNGSLEVLVSVLATNDMALLGASNIFVYYKVGGVWVTCETISSDYPGMTTEDSLLHEDYVYFDTIEDSYLKVEVVIYAKDYSGESDARVLTYYVYT